MTWSLASGLDRIACDGALIVAESSRDPDLAAFVGPVHLGKSILILRRDGSAVLGYLTDMEREEAAESGLPLLDPETLGVEKLRSRHGFSGDFWAELLQRALKLAGVAPDSSSTLALGGRAALGAMHAALAMLQTAGWQFVDGGPLLRMYRKRKTEMQQAVIRQAAEGVCDAFRRVASILAETATGEPDLAWQGGPLTAGVLRREIGQVLATHGLSEPEGNIIAAGAAAGVPHSKGANDRVLRRGESIVIDLFPKGMMFADCTRTFCIGPPASAAARAFELVQEALAAAHARARSGLAAWELQRQTCELFEGAGVSTPLSDPGTKRGYVHGLGHGVGFELHEYPSFARGAEQEGVLEVGDVLTLEPGLYDAEAGYGVRLEDLCLVTEDGVENLTPLPYEMDPRSWSPTRGAASA